MADRNQPLSPRERAKGIKKEPSDVLSPDAACSEDAMSPRSIDLSLEPPASPVSLGEHVEDGMEVSVTVGGLDLVLGE